MRQGSFTIYIAISVLCSSSIFAFDGERQGFILGGGLGGAFVSYTTTSSYLPESVSKDIGAIHSVFKIGYAPSNVFEIYYISKVSWWSGVNTEGYYDDQLQTLGLAAVGASYHLNNESNEGWFMSGGFGLSSLLTLSFNSGDGYSGFGLYGGAGYEFIEHWSVQLDLIYSSVSNSDVDVSSVSISITINGLAY